MNDTDCPNAVVAHPKGILGGVDHQFTGRVERVDVAFLQTLLEHDIIPVIPPLGCDGAGHSYRLNSDGVAVEVAKALRAIKLVFLTTEGGDKTTPVGAPWRTWRRLDPIAIA